MENQDSFSLSLNDLRYRETLLFYDLPLIVHLDTPRLGKSWILYWYDLDELENDMYYLFDIPEKFIQDYKDNKIALLELLQKSEPIVYIIKNYLESIEGSIKFSEIPSDNLPEPGTLYRNNL